MSAVATLHAVKDLIVDPARWTQGAFARKSDGIQVDATDKQAVCWCLRGALKKVVMQRGIFFDRATEQLESLVTKREIAGFNDRHSHAEVIALLDRAIAAAEAQS